MATRYYKLWLVPALVLLFSHAALMSQPVVFTPTNVSCNGANDASMLIEVNGITQPYYYYFYDLDNLKIVVKIGPTNDPSHTFSNLVPNSLYAFAVKDAADTTIIHLSTLLTFSQPPALNATLNKTNATCYGTSTGSISITSPTGGYGTYDFTIDGGANWQPTGTFNGLPAGFYDVQIRDRAHPACVKILNANYEITQPAQLNATLTTTSPKCAGVKTGSIELSSPTGGTGTGYQYTITGIAPWSASTTGTYTYTTLGPGTYNVVMRDAGQTSCTRTLNGALVITEPTPLATPDIVIQKGLTCNEGSDGELRAVQTGGTPPYSYTWQKGSGTIFTDIGQTTQVATGLSQGIYRVLINDANLCGPTNAIEYFISGFTDSIPPVFVHDGSVAITTCAGQSNGSIDISAHGGKKPYRFSITTGGASGYQADSLFSNLGGGTYQSWVMDRKGCKKSGPDVTIGVTPNDPVSVSITANPAAAICPATSVTFTATPVNGGTTPAYQWRLNGTNVGTNSPTYTNAALANGDQVSVILTSSLRCTSGNPATSNTYTASLLTPPSISGHPASQTLCAGANVTFTVTAAGSGLTYQWRKNGANISGATLSSYTINNITTADAANYTVVVTGTCGAVTSNAAALVVNTVPLIGTQPASIDRCVGQSATFSVTASGTITSYQWRKGGVNISGATNASYTIASVATTDAGNYDVVITGPCGTATSTAAALTVNTIPVITDQPDNDTKCVGQSSTFSVTATGTVTSYQWRKNGANIAGANAATYNIASVTVTDAANYTVVITGPCGTVTSTAATLTVNTAPAITSQPANATACVGQGATFTVTANGTITGYQWRKGGVNIPGATNASYTIASVATTDAGNYDVVITGPCGTATSTAAVLTVNTIPVITDQPDNDTKCVGQASTFSVTATGTITSYQWRRNGTNIAGANAASYTIASVATTSAGNYDVVITGPCGTATSTAAVLTVNTIPAITSQPANAAVCVGQSASFTVTASGTITSYQWRKGGVNIPGATNASYSIASVATTDAGNYDVVITGPCGTATSTAAVLTVNTVPVITDQPDNDTRCVGQSSTFSVTATGTITSYQWRKDGANITGANAATYTIASVAAASAGNYDVVITGPCGTATSTAATLTVTTIPVITDQPDNDTRCVGESATFTVAATGTVASYQWRKGGVNIPGATNASYTIAVVATTDAGNYDVVVTGPCGTVTSTAAVLTVNTIPVITDQPDDIVICAGGNATFTVSASGGNLNYQWLKNGVNIPGANSATYTLTGIATTDAGDFSVVISNSCGTTTSTDATLTVNTVPVVTDQPDSQTICAGDNVTFTVVSSGLNLTYQWQKNSANITGANGSSYTINSIANGDAGNYTVVVTNSCGTVTSGAATLIVNNAPVVTTQPIGVTECPGQNVTFTVAASGLNLTYLWRRNSIPLSPAVTTPSLTLNNIDAGDAGSYDVVVTNACGSAISNAALLTVAENPVVTTHPTDQDLCEGGDVSFSVSATGTNISYQWRKDGANLAGETGTTLDLTAVTLAVVGNYDVLVYGMCDTVASNPAVLTVYPATRADIIDSDTIVCKESSVEFNVAASGQGSLIYQWQRLYYGSWIDLVDDVRISGSTTPVLGINVVDQPDSGLYRVQVNGGCGSVYSEPVRLDINSLIATIGTPAPFMIDAVTTFIEVGVTIEDHFLKHDLGFALVAPDGTEVMLKAPGKYCAPNFPTVDVDVKFNTKADPADTIDYCPPGNLVTGTFAATGNWDVLHGMDPSNGAWEVRIYDAENANGDVSDGIITSATLTFIDLDINGDTAVVNYNSGPIVTSIINPISGELRPTPYVVPIRLMTTCFNSEDAHAVVTVQGGIAPFTYEWTGPTVEPDEPDVMLGPGTYSVLVTDALGCTSIATVEVSAPPAIVFDDVVHTGTIVCHGSPDGVIRSKASGGAGSFTYTLLPGNIASAVADSGVFYGLTAGIYTIRATDINGCVLDSVIQIFEHAQLTVQIDLVQVTVPGTGSITLTASGGVPPYSYSIDNGVTQQASGSFTGLDAGIYQVYVVDALGCTYTETVNLSIELLDVTVTKTDVTCGGYADGSFLLIMNDGVAPYTLTGSFTEPLTTNDIFFSFTGQEIGSYDVRIEDSEGRVFIETIEINSPAPIVALETITNSTCSSSSDDGAIELVVSGGSGSVYSFEWSTGATTKDLLGIDAGDYHVTITDETSCVAEFDYVVGATTFVQVDAGDDVTICSATEFQLDGEALTADYDSLRWTPGRLVDDPSIFDPVASITESTKFYLTLYENGCSNTDSVEISVYEHVEFLIYQVINGVSVEPLDTVVYIGEGESINLFAGNLENPNTPYVHWTPDTYLNDPLSEYVTATPPVDITYVAIGTTLDGCHEYDTLLIIIRRPIKIYTGFSPNEDGVNDTWEIENAEGYGDLIRVRVYNRWGEPVFESKGYGGSQEWDGTRNGRPMPVGSYYYIIDVKDGESEPYTGTVTILR